MRPQLISLTLVGATIVAPSAPAQGLISSAALPLAVSDVYQGRNRRPEHTERFSRKVKISRNGSVTISNLSGDMTVTAGSGDEVSIEAIKRTRGDLTQLAAVQIEINELPNRVEIRTGRTAGDAPVSVDYTITVPATVSVEMRSVSGNLKVTGVQGAVRAESVNGNIAASTTPRLEIAKSISGDIVLSDVGSDGELTASTVSGDVQATGLKSHGIEMTTVSGDLSLSNVACERLGLRSVSGNLEYAGTLAPSGRYMFNSHSGDVRLALAGGTGFELEASTFSGSFRSDLPLTIIEGAAGRGTGLPSVPPVPPGAAVPPALPVPPGSSGRGRPDRTPLDSSVHARFGDASAVITIRTFSGDMEIAKGGG